MIGALFEFLFEIIIEFAIGLVVEVAAEYGFHFFEEARESKTLGPIVGVVGYAIIGAVLGLLSYFLIPVHILQNDVLRVAGTIISPISMGLSLCLVSWFVARKDRHEPFWSTSKFIQGVLFAVSYSLARSFVITD